MTPFEPIPAEGFLVGGAVRDSLLERDSHDLDWLVPDARRAAQHAAERLGGSAFELDDERGHWRVLAAGRTRDYIPLTVPLEEDLRARDFTANALAATADGTIVDVTGGSEDIRRRLLRMTSAEALLRDPLRLFRGVRLAAQLGFELEAGTRSAVTEGAALLASGRLPLPAWERIREELDTMLMGAAPGTAFAALEGLGLLPVALPEVAAGRGVAQGGFHHLDVLDHCLETLERLASIFPDADPALRWAALLHDVGKPFTREKGEDGRIRFYGHDWRGAGLAREAMKRLRRPQRECERTAGLVRYHMLPLPRDERQARRFTHRRRELLPDLLQLMIADREAARGPLSSEATRRAYRTALSRIIAILEEPAPPGPLLDGNEVMELLGSGPGPRVGEALRVLAEARAVGDITDREDAVRALEKLARSRGWLES